MFLVIASGLGIGAVYAMTALVYNVMFSTSKVLAFSTGQFAMVGGILTAFITMNLHLPIWLAFLACLASGCLFGLLTDLVAVRPLLSATDNHLWVLSTLAVGTMVQEAAGLIWGTEPTPFPRILPLPLSGPWDQKYWLPVAAALLMTAGLELFYRTTMIGKLFIALSEDAFAARARGIQTTRLRALSYAMAGTLGALAGFAAGQLTFADFSLGTALALSGFIALAVGGIGSSVGALVGGAALGLLTSFTDFYVGGQYQKTIAIGALILFLVLKPEGLFGAKRVRAV